MTVAGEMDWITTMPSEVLHHIFHDVGVGDISSLSKTCRALNAFLRNNIPLYREMYLMRFDPPRSENYSNWESRLHDLLRMERVLSSGSIQKKASNLTFMASIVDHFIKNSPPGLPSKNHQFLTECFQDKANQEALFCQSAIFTRDARPTRSFNERQASAKLHCLYGVPRSRSDPFPNPRPRELRSNKILHSYACSVVYDLRNYTDENKWGPFRDDGLATVDWERVEVIMVIVRHNVALYTLGSRALTLQLSARSHLTQHWVTPWKGTCPDSYKPITISELPQPAPPVNDDDPYDVSGTWMRVICFLDFHDLHNYNFSTMPPNDVPREPMNTQEAIRILLMEITVTDIKYPGEEGGPEADDGQFPVVYFEGKSRAMNSNWDPNQHSKTRGTVRTTKEGEVRWTTYSLYWGNGSEERWKSEGIQIGGAKSARGVFGHWFDKLRSDEGPAGPSVFWKLSNEINEDFNGGDTDTDEDDNVEDEYIDDPDADEDEEPEAEGGDSQAIGLQGILDLLNVQSSQGSASGSGS